MVKWYEKEQNKRRIPPKKLKHSNATRRKRDSKETRRSIPEYCIYKLEYSPEIMSITKYPYHQNAEHNRIRTRRQYHSSNIISVRTTTRTCNQSHHEAAIPEDFTINLPMETEDYRSLKDRITQVYQKSKTELIEEALGMISVDGQKPSFCLLRIQRKLSEFHLTRVNDVFKHRLLQAKPISKRSSLSAILDLPPDKFANLVNTTYSYSKDTFQENTQVYATQPSSSSSYARQPQPTPRNSTADNSNHLFSPGKRPKI